jgi:hypothetical protein
MCRNYRSRVSFNTNHAAVVVGSQESDLWVGCKDPEAVVLLAERLHKPALL